MRDVEASTLGGRALLAVRVLWWLILPIALAAPLVAGQQQYGRLRQELAGWAAAGVQLAEFEPVTGVPFSPQAVAAGLRDNQTIVVVQGRPVSTPDEVRAAGAAGPPDRPLRFVTLDAAGTRRAYDLDRTRGALDAFRHQTGLPYAVLAWITFAIEIAPTLVWLAAAIALFRVRSRERVAAILSLGALGVAASSLWDYQLGGGWLFQGLGGVLAGSAFVAVSYGLMAFPNGPLTRWQKVVLALLGLCGVAYAALEFADEDSEGVGALMLLTGLIAGAVAVWGRWRRAPPGIQRQQIKWAAAGTVGGTALLICAVVVIAVVGAGDPPFGIEFWVTAVGLLLANMGFAAVMLGILVALLRYRLYDAESVIGRSAVLGVLTVGAVAVWAAVEKAFQGVMSDLVGLDNGPGLAALVATLGALVVVPARRRLSGWTQARFQPGVAALRQDVPERLRDLRDAAPPDEIAEVLAREIASAMRVEQAAVVHSGGEVVAVVGLTPTQVSDWITNHTGVLNRENARDPLFPLRVGLPAGHAAMPERWLLLGRRPDGSPASPDDRRAVVDLAVPIGRALKVAEARQARDAGLFAEIEALRQQVARLARMPVD